MTTVVQVIVKTVTQGASSTENSDTTITLLTTISTTTTIPTKTSTVVRSTSSSELSYSETISDNLSYASATSSGISTTTPYKASKTTSLSSSISTSTSLSALASTGSSTSEKNLGLVIGIPLAVISVFVLAALAWLFLRKKINSRSTEYLTYDLERDGKADAAIERTAQISRPFQPDLDGSLDDKPPKFLNRLSRMVSPEWVSSWTVKSPAILRSFNLKRAKTPDVPSTPLENPDLSQKYSGYRAKKPPSLDLSKCSSNTASSDKTLLVIKTFKAEAYGELSVMVGDLAIPNSTRGDYVHVSLKNREGYGFVPLSCLRQY